MKELKKQIKHIRGLGKVLIKIAEEIEKEDKISKEHFELLKKVGSDVLFKGVALDYKEDLK